MPNMALIPHAATRIAPLVGLVDGYPTATHKLETTTGGAPIEDGRQVTDHAVARQAKLELTGWVSDFNGGNRPHDAWEEIRRLHKASKAVTVITEWGVYPEMLIVSAEAPQTARGLRFTLVLEEVIRVGVTDADLSAGAISGPASGRSAEVARGYQPLGPFGPRGIA